MNEFEVHSAKEFVMEYAKGRIISLGRDSTRSGINFIFRFKKFEMRRKFLASGLACIWSVAKMSCVNTLIGFQMQKFPYFFEKERPKWIAEIRKTWAESLTLKLEIVLYFFCSNYWAFGWRRIRSTIAMSIELTTDFIGLRKPLKSIYCSLLFRQLHRSTFSREKNEKKHRCRIQFGTYCSISYILNGFGTFWSTWNK